MKKNHEHSIGRFGLPLEREPSIMFASKSDLARELRRAEAAHAEHEAVAGGAHDENWPEWYAEYMAGERS